MVPSGILLYLQKCHYSTRYNRPDKSFLELPQFSQSVHKSKQNFGDSVALMLPKSGMIYLMRSVLPQLAPVSEKKGKILFLQKKFSHLNLASPWYLTWQRLWNDDGKLL